MFDKEERRPQHTDGDQRTGTTNTPSIPDHPVNRFAVRAVAEAILAAMPATWLRRAEALEAARPRPGEFHGNATRDELNARWQELTDMAEACRWHAALLLDEPHDLLHEINADVAALAGIDTEAVAA